MSIKCRPRTNGLPSQTGRGNGVRLLCLSCFDPRQLIRTIRDTGDIVSVSLLGQTLVILDNPRHAVELLDRRSNIYSDRPVLMMAGELVGWNQALALSRYGDRFKEYRKFFHKVIGSRSNLQRFHGLVETETHKFLRRVLHGPDEVHAHIRKSVFHSAPIHPALFTWN